MSGRWSDPSERSGAVQIWGKVRDKQELIENLGAYIPN